MPGKLNKKIPAAVFILSVIAVLIAIAVLCITHPSILLCQYGNYVTNSTHPIITFSSPDPIFSVSADEDRVVWCAGARKDDSAWCSKIYSQSLSEQKHRLLIDRNDGKLQTMPAKLSHDRMAWVEYGQDTKVAGVSWTLFSEKAGKRIAVFSNRDNPELAFPNFDLSDDYIVYDHFIASPHDGFDSFIAIHSFRDGKTRTIPAVKGFDCFAPTLYRNQVLFCKLSLAPSGAIRSRLCLYDMETEKLGEFDFTDSAYQASMNDQYIVYKESDSLYNYGKIRLYHLKTGKLLTLSAGDSGGEQPWIGDRYVVWESPQFDKIEGFDLTSMRKIIFEKGRSGKPFLKGSSLVWVAEPMEGQAVIHFLKL